MKQMNEAPKGQSKADAFADAAKAMEAQAMPQGEQVKHNFNDYLVDMTRQEERPDFRLRVNGIGIIPSGGITAITGKAKQGKTQWLVAMAAVMLSGKAFGAMSRETAPRSVLWCDTEQSKYDIQTNMARLYHLAGVQPGTASQAIGLNILALRPCQANDRLAIIQNAIEATNPDIVIIDGIRDLLHDFNDITQTDEVITWLLQNISARPQCNIFCVIHTNEGSDKMRGHLGTELMNKCSDRFTIDKRNGYFAAQHTARHQEIAAAFTFMIDDEGQLVASTPEGEKQSKLIENPYDTLAAIFDEAEVLPFDSIVRRFAKSQGLTLTEAKDIIKSNYINNVIEKAEGGWRLSIERGDEGKWVFKQIFEEDKI